MDRFFHNIPSEEPRVRTGRKKESKTEKEGDRKTDTGQFGEVCEEKLGNSGTWVIFQVIQRRQVFEVLAGSSSFQ